MQEIKCPNCGTVFQVDESEYAQILRQVRDEEFKKELEYRAKDLEEKKKTDVQLVRMEQEKKLGEVITSKASELAEKERIIEQLRMQIAGEKTERELAVSKAVQQKENRRSQQAAQSKQFPAFDFFKKRHLNQSHVLSVPATPDTKEICAGMVALFIINDSPLTYNSFVEIEGISHRKTLTTQCIWCIIIRLAAVAELADARDLKSLALIRRTGSIPVSGTKSEQRLLCSGVFCI